MVSSIQSLANMEYALYGNGSGGFGAYNAPSIVNGYFAVNPRSIFNPYNMYNNYPLSFNGYYPQYNQWGGTFERQGINPVTQRNYNNDMQVIADYYANNNALEEGFKGAAAGGLSWMAFEHIQSLFHPINAKKGTAAAEKVFKNISKNEAFMKENSILVQDGYTAVQQAFRDTCPKGFWSKWLRNPIGAVHKGDDKAIKRLIIETKNAFETASANPTEANIRAAAEATERLQAARGFDGRIIPGKKRTVAERLADKSKVTDSKWSKFGFKSKSASSEITKNVEGLLTRNSGKIGNILKQTFKKDFVGFLIFETVFGLGKIATAFQKDKKTGVKQTGQSIGKAALGTAGWCIGRAAGTWLGAKAGAAIGTAICPGAGTLIGGLIGFTVGSIGMWAGHKLGNKIFGKDVADKVEAEELVQTPEGQARLLELTVPIAEKDKNLSPEVRKAFENIANQYQATAA